jgi:putative transcriptional regulator
LEAYKNMEISYQGLFDMLKKKGIMQKTMREDLNLSGSILTRLKHNGAVTTETIGRICEYLQCTPNDIMEIKFDSKIASSYNDKHKMNLETQIAELQEKLKQI